MFQDRSIPRSIHSELLPVRTNDTAAAWLTWKEIEAEFERIIIVPFHIAWQGPWQLDVPCVGVPNQQVGSLSYDSDKMHTQLSDCNLVSVPDMCTGYLWPP